MGKLWGREPALIIGAIGAVLTAFAAMELPGLNAGQAAALTGAVTAVIIAATTRPVGPSLFVAAFVAVAALFGQYGLELSAEVIAGWSAVIVAGLALFGIRPAVTPNNDPQPIAPNNGAIR
jgi:hypothetical protein